MKPLIYGVVVGLAVLLTGCGTVTPPLNSEPAATVDTSTPPQYPINDSGILGVSPDRRWIYITAHRAQREPAAVPFTDSYGNALFKFPSDIYAAEYAAQIHAQAAALETPTKK